MTLARDVRFGPLVVWSVLACVPLQAHAQLRYAESFDAWTDGCIAAGVCGDTTLGLGSRGIAISTDCALAGSCIELGYDVEGEITLDPFGTTWAPSPNAIAVSLWLNLGPAFFRGDGSFRGGFSELVRAYCEPGPCNVLFELHVDPSDSSPVLVWQREAAENVVVREVCTLRVAPTAGWHRLYARGSWDSTTAIGECELAWDDTTMSVADASFAGAGGEPTRLTDVLVAGTSTTDSLPRTSLDDVCIGVTDVECPRGAFVPRDGGPSPPSPPPPSPSSPIGAFQGGGGCACSVGVQGASTPIPACIATLTVLAALAARRRTRRRR